MFILPLVIICNFWSNKMIPEVMGHFYYCIIQLGGDYVLDKTGRVVLAYNSETPSARPSIDYIIKAIQVGCRMLLHAGL